MRLWRLCVVSAVVATWAGCGGEDDPVPPPPGDNGGQANDASMPEAGPNNGGGGNSGADGSMGGVGGMDEPDAQAGAGGADEPDADAGPGGNGGEGGDGGDGGGGTGGVPDLPDVFVPDLDAGPDASDADAAVADAAEAGPPPFDPGPPGTLVEFPLPVIEGGATSSNGESRIAVGSDDKLYVTDTGMAVLYRMDVEGNVEEFALAPSSQPRGITLGPDGNVWFVQYGNDKIGRITPSGTVTEFSIPNVPVGGSGPNGITLGQDGNLWYTEQKGSRVGRIAVTPVDGGYDVNITPLNLPATGRFPKDITRGPDGDNHIWFTEQIGRVAKVTTGLFIDSTMEYGNGVITSAPLGIVNGPDGNLWFTEVADLVGQSDTSGTITEHDVDTSGCVPLSITVGSDDMLWYTCYQHSMLGRTDPGDPGNPESHTLFANSEPTGIVSGPGGALWFVDEGLRSVGYMVPPL